MLIVSMKQWINGELLIVCIIVRNGSLSTSSNIVFDIGVISHSNINLFQASESKLTNYCATRVYFLSLFSCNFDDKLSP